MANDLMADDWRRGAAETVGAAEAEHTEGVPIRTITEAGLVRLARQKQEINTQAVHALKEIEELRRRQEQLEKVKSGLEALARRQDEYEHGKREMLDKLRHGIAWLDKEEAAALRRAEVLAVTRERFRETLNELQAIHEASWSDEHYETELNKALVLVDDAKAVYKKAMARIEAEQEGGPTGRTKPGPPARDMAGEWGDGLRFRDSVKVGVGLCLPFAALLLVLFLAYVTLRVTGVLP